MAHPLIILLLAFAVALPATTAHAVINGEPVRGTDPLRRWTVKVESTRGELCTGVAIAPDFVLTAAHCVLGGGRFRVTNFASGAARTIPVIALRAHESFLPNRSPNTQPGRDLALMRLAEPLGDYIQPSGSSGVSFGETITIAGFGLSRENNRATARTLRTARLISAGAYTSANSVVVAVDGEGLGMAPGAGACKGDSGGPILRGGSGSTELVGIISWSSGPQNHPVRRVCGGFTAMTPLAENSAWIASTMASLGRSEAQGSVAAPAPRQRRQQARARPATQPAPLMQERTSGAN